MCEVPLSADDAALQLMGIVLFAVVCLVVLWNIGSRDTIDENDE